MSRNAGLIGLASALLLGGCASTTTAGAPRPAACEQIDCARMAAVEHVARKRGVRVIWVAPPQKRQDAEANDS